MFCHDLLLMYLGVFWSLYRDLFKGKYCHTCHMLVTQGLPSSFACVLLHKFTNNQRLFFLVNFMISYYAFSFHVIMFS